MSIAGPPEAAFDSLSPTQIYFLQSLPKAELHAHLNGSIPLSVLQELVSEHDSIDSPTVYNKSVKVGTPKLMDSSIEKVSDFFALFPAIHALTSTPSSLRRATRAVLSTFLDGDLPQCNYLELRTTPRQTDAMDRNQYLRVVLEELECYDRSRVGLIISLDRRMNNEVLSECVRLACELKTEGKWVVGVDLCGDPTVGDVDIIAPHIAEVKKTGMSVTLHIAETTQNTAEETYKLLSLNPARLGHATFLDEKATCIVLEKKICIEVCLTSNLLCKTVSTLESHHIHQYLKLGHPIAICTDDILPFRTSLLGEYALLLAQPPLGLGLSEDMVRKIGEMSLQARFK